MRWLVTSPIFLPERHGGIEKVVYEFARRIVQMGHDVTILAGTRESMARVDWLEGIKVIRIPILETFASKSFSKWYEINQKALAVIEEEKPDIIWCHDWYFGIGVLSYCESFDTVLVTQLHFIKYQEAGRRLDSWRALIDRTQRALAHAGDLVVVSTPSQAKAIEQRFKTKCEKTLTLPFGFDYCPSSLRTSKAKSAKSNGAFRIAYAGRFEFEKNLTHLIEAVCEVANNIEVQLDLIGSGTEEQLLRSLCKARNAPVRFYPFQDKSEDLWALIDRSHAVILPSLYESFGMIALEALSRGVPVLLSRQVGLSEYLMPERHMIAFDPFETSSIAQAIYRAALGGSQREQMPYFAQSDLKQMLNWDKSVVTLLDSIHELKRRRKNACQYRMPSFAG